MGDLLFMEGQGGDTWTVEGMLEDVLKAVRERPSLSKRAIVVIQDQDGELWSWGAGMGKLTGIGMLATAQLAITNQYVADVCGVK